jgi:hypothetical protein
MATPSENTMKSATSMAMSRIGKSVLGGAKAVVSGVKKLFVKKPEKLVPKFSGDPTETLGEIYKFMRIMDEDRKLNQELSNAHIEEQQHEKDRRNQEIITALTARKIKKPKKEKITTKEGDRPRDEKGRFIKKETAPETPKVEAPKTQPPKVETPTTPTASPKPTIGERVKAAASTAGKVAAPVAAGVITAAKIGAPLILGAAGISIMGETGAKTVDAAIKKGGQIVPNDPKPGVTSYGIFGMNSAAGTAGQFAAQNPQFNMTAKPGSKEFDEQWTKAFNDNPQALFDAQLAWYDRTILKPLRVDLAKSLATNIASDERVVGYMADRRIQYGKTMEGSALKFSSTAQTPEEFIDKMTEFDLQNIGTAFATYLKNHPGNEKGLQTRIKNRKDKALLLESQATSGKRLNDESTYNATGKKELNIQQQKIENQQNLSIVNQNTNKPEEGTTSKPNETNALIAKGQKK